MSEIAHFPKVALTHCPIGLFIDAHGNLCLKTEYIGNEGRIDAYIVSSGEFFWGDAPQTIASQRKQLVLPVTNEEVDAFTAHIIAIIIAEQESPST